MPGAASDARHHLEKAISSSLELEETSTTFTTASSKHEDFSGLDHILDRNTHLGEVSFGFRVPKKEISLEISKGPPQMIKEKRGKAAVTQGEPPHGGRQVFVTRPGLPGHTPEDISSLPCPDDRPHDSTKRQQHC